MTVVFRLGCDGRLLESGGKHQQVVAQIGILTAYVILPLRNQDKSPSGGSSQSPQTQGKRVTGQLTHIEGWHYTIKESRGEEVSFGVTSATQDPHEVKEGDQIVP
jgi:hypothetical protein